jgi:hypothetical protein
MLQPPLPSYQTFSTQNITVPAATQPASRSGWHMEFLTYVSNLALGKWIYLVFSYSVILFGVVIGPYLIICHATGYLIGSSLLPFANGKDLVFKLEKDIIFWILVYVGIQSYKLLTDMQKLVFGDESSILNQIKDGVVEIIKAIKD